MHNSIPSAKFHELTDETRAVRQESPLRAPQRPSHTMSARATADIARHVICTTTKVRHASTTTALARPKPGKKIKPVHGQQIFVYSHFQTNQVVYSLTKSLNVCFVPLLSVIITPCLTYTPLSYRTMTLSANSPSTAKRRSPGPCAKTSGPRWPR
jgi:hypothetical protein